MHPACAILEYLSLMKLDFSFNPSRCQSKQSEIALASLWMGCKERRTHDDWQKWYEFAQKQYWQVEEEERLPKREEEHLKVEQEGLQHEEVKRMCQDNEWLCEIEVQKWEEAQATWEAKELIAADAEAHRLEWINAKWQREEKMHTGKAKWRVLHTTPCLVMWIVC